MLTIGMYVLCQMWQSDGLEAPEKACREGKWGARCEQANLSRPNYRLSLSLPSSSLYPLVANYLNLGKQDGQ